MQNDIEEFFRDMKKTDSLRHVPPFEDFIVRHKKRWWLYGVAATISLLTALTFMIPESIRVSSDQVLLDTDSSPTVTNTLNEQQEVTFLEWEAPSDYLIEDFN